MKVILAITLICLMAITSVSQKSKDDFGLPELHKIKTVTLSPSYSCRTPEDFSKGYENAALFLSKRSRPHSPDLVFDGACGGKDDFYGSTSGDDMTLIADIGDFPVEVLSAQLAFVNAGNRRSFELSHFVNRVRVQPKHTYAVLINKSDLRGLFVFVVDEYLPNKSVRLRYAVKEYQILSTRAQSQGFDWERKNDE